MHNSVHELAKVLQGLPNANQVSIGLFKNGSEHYFGLIKKNQEVVAVENSNSAFEIGSITKCFTANILARLILENKVNLNDPIHKYLPFNLKGNHVITFGHLVSHTSGLPRLPGDFFTYPEYDENNPYLNYTEQRLVTYLTEKLKLETLPGSNCNYSNLGYGLLGYVLSVITGQSFINLTKERIFDLVGMPDSGFSKSALTTSLVKGSDKDGNITNNWDGGILNGCVGIFSTSKDLLKFSRQSLNLVNGVNKIQLQELSELRAGVNICMGWATTSTENEPKIYWHSGGTAGYGATVMFSVNLNAAVVILSNIEPTVFKEVVEPQAKEILFG